MAASPTSPQYGLTVSLDGSGGCRAGVMGDDNRPVIEVRPQGVRAVVILLAEPLVHFQCALNGAIGSVDIRAYGSNEQLVEHRQEQHQGQAGVMFHFPGIVRVELELKFATISEI